MDPTTKILTALSPSTGTQYAVMWNVPYCEAVGALMYSMLRTHPDISFAITTVSKFLSNWKGPLGGSKTNLSVPTQDAKLEAVVWWNGEGVGWFCWCWWEHGRRSVCDVRICIPGRWRGSILEYKMAGDSVIVDNREWVHHCNSHGKRSAVAMIVDWSGVQTISPQHCHHTLLWQSIHDCTLKGPPISCLH